MKYQYIYQFLAELTRTHKVFLHYQSLLTNEEKILLKQNPSLLTPASKNINLFNPTSFNERLIQLENLKKINNLNILPADRLKSKDKNWSIIAAKKLFRLVLPYNLELLRLLIKLKELGFLTFTVHPRTVIIDINITSYSKVVIHSRPGRQIFKKVSSKLNLTSQTSQTINQPQSNNANILWTKDNGLGLSILRTSKGFLTTIEAREQNIGGELLFSIL